jgi:hypothetical protein
MTMATPGLSGPRQELFDLLNAKRQARMMYALEHPDIVSNLGEIFEAADTDVLARDINSLGDAYVKHLLKLHNSGANARYVW